MGRVEALLRGLNRRFVTTEAVLTAPRGQVHLGRWAREGLARAQPLRVPCTFPDLRDDEHLRAAIHWVVRRQVEGLRAAAATGSGTALRPLLDRAERVLVQVAGTPPMRPGAGDRERWAREPMASRVFREGVQAVGWTADERGLAGPAESTGLAWRLDMERFFEAWVESLAEAWGRRAGMTTRAGRTEATRVPLAWSPPRAAGLRSLLPDVVLTRPDHAVVIDAKYKPHGALLLAEGRGGLVEEQQEAHRADVHQALAYSTLFPTGRVTAVLAYPMRLDHFRAATERGATFARTTVLAHPDRRVDLVVCSLPLGAPSSEARAALAAALG